MTNLTKREIVLEIYRKSGFSQKQIVDTVQQTLDIIQKALADGRNVELRNFGVLEVQVRKQRIGRNPNKPDSAVVIPERAVVKFKSGKVLKQQLKKIDLNTLRRSGARVVESDAAEDEESDAPASSGAAGAHDGGDVNEHPLRKNAASNAPTPQK
jgi:nucleoid DNA-binding protein